MIDQLEDTDGLIGPSMTYGHRTHGLGQDPLTPIHDGIKGWMAPWIIRSADDIPSCHMTGDAMVEVSR